MAIDTALATRLDRFHSFPTEAEAIALAEELLQQGRATDALNVIETVHMTVPERSKLWMLESVARSRLTGSHAKRNDKHAEKMESLSGELTKVTRSQPRTESEHIVQPWLVSLDTSHEVQLPSVARFKSSAMIVLGMLTLTLAAAVVALFSMRAQPRTSSNHGMSGDIPISDRVPVDESLFWRDAIEDFYIEGQSDKALSLAHQAAAHFPADFMLNAWVEWLNGQRVRTDGYVPLVPKDKAWLAVATDDDTALSSIYLADPRTQRLLSRMFMDKGRHALAQALSAQSVQAQPADRQGRLLWAESSIAVSDAERALIALGPLSLSDPQVARWYADAALLKRDQASLARADKAIEELLKPTLHSNHDSAPSPMTEQSTWLAYEVRINVATGNLSKAAASMKALRGVQPKPSVGVQEAFSDFYLAKGWDHPEFLYTHTAALKKLNPNVTAPDSPLLKKIAIAAMRLGHEDRATAWLHLWNERHPQDAEAAFWLGSLLEATGKMDEACALFSRLEHPAKVWIGGGAPFAVETSQLAAMGMSRCDLASSPRNFMRDASPFSRIWQAVTDAKRWARLKKVDAAAQSLHLTESSDLQRTLFDVPLLWRSICHTWVSIEKWSEAEVSCRGLAAQLPASAGVWMDLHDVYTALGKEREADDALDRARSLQAVMKSQ